MLCEWKLGYVRMEDAIVLILVLMEYALRESRFERREREERVLILVLMEYALREIWQILWSHGPDGLNPCFNGICSASI